MTPWRSITSSEWQYQGIKLFQFTNMILFYVIILKHLKHNLLPPLDVVQLKEFIEGLKSDWSHF